MLLITLLKKAEKEMRKLAHTVEMASLDMGGEN